MDSIEYYKTVDGKRMHVGMRVFFDKDIKSSTEGYEIAGFDDCPYFINEHSVEEWVPKNVYASFEEYSKNKIGIKQKHPAYIYYMSLPCRKFNKNDQVCAVYSVRDNGDILLYGFGSYKIYDDGIEYKHNSINHVDMFIRNLSCVDLGIDGIVCAGTTIIISKDDGEQLIKLGKSVIMKKVPSYHIITGNS